MPRTWALHNVTGADGFEVGWMDLEWVDGAPSELTDPLGVVGQRVQKATAEAAGSNLFEPRWGSAFGSRLGSKLLGQATLRELGGIVAATMNNLITMDREDAARLGLVPGEILAQATKIEVLTDGTAVAMIVTLVTAAGTKTITVKA